MQRSEWEGDIFHTISPGPNEAFVGTGHPYNPTAQRQRDEQRLWRGGLVLPPCLPALPVHSGSTYTEKDKQRLAYTTPGSSACGATGRALPLHNSIQYLDKSITCRKLGRGSPRKQHIWFERGVADWVTAPSIRVRPLEMFGPWKTSRSSLLWYLCQAQGAPAQNTVPSCSLL